MCVCGCVLAAVVVGGTSSRVSVVTSGTKWINNNNTILRRGLVAAASDCCCCCCLCVSELTSSALLRWTVCDPRGCVAAACTAVLWLCCAPTGRPADGDQEVIHSFMATPLNLNVLHMSFICDDSQRLLCSTDSAIRCDARRYFSGSFVSPVQSGPGHTMLTIATVAPLPPLASAIVYWPSSPLPTSTLHPFLVQIT